MRVLVFSSSFPNPVEPVNGSFVYKPLQAFPAEHELVVVAPVPFGLSWRRGAKDVIERKEQMELGHDLVWVYRPRYLLLPYNLLRPLIGFIEFLLSYPRIRKLHRHKPIDLIHTHFAYPDGIAVRWISRLLGIPYLVTEHRGLLRETLNNFWISGQLLKTYRKASKVVTVSEFSARVLAEFGIDSAVIPNGIDFDRFTVAPPRARPTMLVVIASLIPAKGIDYLIQALALLRERGRDYELDIIGAGKHRTALEELVCSLKLEDRVTFKGQLVPIKVEEILSHYDALIVSSLRESFSIVLIEAMASGLPVVATRCGGPESIVNSDTGVLVSPGSADALAEGVLELEKNWEQYDPYLIRDYARNKYSLDGVMNAYVEIYESIQKEKAE